MEANTIEIRETEDLKKWVDAMVCPPDARVKSNIEIRFVLTGQRTMILELVSPKDGYLSSRATKENLVGAGRFTVMDPAGAEWDSFTCRTTLGKDQPEDPEEAKKMLFFVRMTLTRWLAKLILEKTTDTSNLDAPRH